MASHRYYYSTLHSHLFRTILANFSFYKIFYLFDIRYNKKNIQDVGDTKLWNSALYVMLQTSLFIFEKVAF
jgi:hypothetical protein